MTNKVFSMSRGLLFRTLEAVQIRCYIFLIIHKKEINMQVICWNLAEWFLIALVNLCPTLSFDCRYYNDLYVFDLDQFKVFFTLILCLTFILIAWLYNPCFCCHIQWQEIKPKPGCMWPSARSGFQFFVSQDEVIIDIWMAKHWLLFFLLSFAM